MGVLGRIFGPRLAKPRLDWLQIEVAATCNAACPYCMTTCRGEPWRGGLMEMRTFERLRPSFPDCGLVFLQGWGEPLLHPEFWRMARQAKSAGAATGFTTNATLLDERRLVQLVESGVDIVAVSLAGVVPETQERFRPGCKLEQIDRALKGLRELKRARHSESPRLHVAFVLLRSNWHEVGELVNLAARWGAAQVVVSNLSWIGSPELQEESILENPPLWEEVEVVLERARQDAAEKGIQLDYSGPGTGPPRATCKENVLKSLFVSHGGDVSPCVFSNLRSSSGGQLGHYSGGQRHQTERLVFGNVRDETLPTIWNSAKALQFRRSFQDRLSLVTPGSNGLPVTCQHCYKILER